MLASFNVVAVAAHSGDRVASLAAANLGPEKERPHSPCFSFLFLSRRKRGNTPAGRNGFPGCGIRLGPLTLRRSQIRFAAGKFQKRYRALRCSPARYQRELPPAESRAACGGCRADVQVAHANDQIEIARPMGGRKTARQLEPDASNWAPTEFERPESRMNVGKAAHVQAIPSDDRFFPKLERQKEPPDSPIQRSTTSERKQRNVRLDFDPGHPPE